MRRVRATGFEASREALRLGYTSTGEWLESDGAAMRERLVAPR